MIRALIDFFTPFRMHEVTGLELAQALKRAGYRPNFRRLPAETVRAMARCVQK